MSEHGPSVPPKAWYGIATDRPTLGAVGVLALLGLGVLVGGGLFALVFAIEGAVPAGTPETLVTFTHVAQAMGARGPDG